MSLPTYTEPQVSFLILDFKRESAARSCLQSLRDHIKVPARLIYCHNGVEDYPLDLLKQGLIDDLIMPRTNGGLGLGTRALYAACFSPLAISWQVDQIMGRDFTQQELDALAATLDQMTGGGDIVKSISLAGPVCDTAGVRHIYSERALITKTAFYREMEHSLPLSHGGAGPYADIMWREEQIQRHYAENGYLHWTSWPLLAIDNGRDSVRTNPDGSEWVHEPDTKKCWLKKGPVKERFVYPKFSEREWAEVIATQSWPPGQIPEQERAHSFTVPQWH